ncbi:hypothetical protein DFH29DRAFT_617041 [Suillus ampliporus]|nr:hypothetical protein DFH29DRAFT_617041 [Suillus ampliporus]
MTVVSNSPGWWPSINSYRIGSYFVVSACAGLIYDWVLTFGQEVELIWRQRWSLMTVLYLSVRYLGIIFATLNIMCDVPTIPLTNVVSYMTFTAEYWIAFVVNQILGVMMITRLHAMYQRSRKVLILLIVIYLAVHITNGVITSMAMKSISGDELILSGTYQCNIYYEAPLLSAISWILGTIWEVLALCLSIWIAMKHFRELRRQSAGGIIGDCFAVLIKFHVIYFASFLAVSSYALFLFFSTILGDASSQIFAGFLLIFDIVQMFVLGPRLIIGIREYHAKLVADSDTATAMTSIAFQERVHVSTSSSV